MKRTMKKIFALITVGVLLSACDMITYEGPYNTDGVFDGNKSAYLYFKQQKDTLQEYSFSLSPQDEIEHTFKVPVRVVGVPAKNITKVGVAVIPELTTAEEGVHYKPFANEVVIPANSLEGYIEVVMLRAQLPKQENEKKRLVLKLTSTPDLQVMGGELNQVVLSVDDFFDDKDLEQYWNTAFSSVLGVYNRAVYLKLLSLYDNNPNTLWGEMWQTPFYIKWNETVSYFEAHPELGIKIELPDWMKNSLPYQD